MRRRYGFTPEGNIFEITAERRPDAPSSHYVIGDSIPPTYNHADNRVYESKSELRRVNKAMGLVELGNDRPQRRENYDQRELHREIERVMRDYG